MVRTVWGRAALMLLALFTGLAWADQPPPSQWAPEMAAFAAADKQQPPPKDGVLFIGSSSIHAWTSLAQDFPGVPVINRGFGGSAIADSTYYADRIAIPYRPRVIVMYAGDNDMSEGATPEQVLRDVQAFVARVQRSLPHTTIVYISIKPSLARESLWPRMREANAAVAHWMQGHKGLRFVDISGAMLDAQGRPRPELLREDGLHMTAAGYAIWVAALKPVLAAYGFPAHGA